MPGGGAGILNCFYSQRSLSLMPTRAIVVHYHELWLKGRNRLFFLNRLSDALRRSLESPPADRLHPPGDPILPSLRRGI